MPSPSYPGTPLPIGYIEVQAAWTGAKTSAELEAIIRETREKAERENPGLIRHGGRVEMMKDGAGVTHCHLYLGYAPPDVRAEPLDPRNLNNAPLPQPGGMSPDDIAMPVGWKEEQFGRGT